MDKELPHKFFRGFRIPFWADENYFIQAADYKPKKGDIFITSYPKCGTTWVQHIVYLLLRQGNPANNMAQVISSIPFPEQDGFPDNLFNVLALKYHLPFRLMPYNPNARYIYVARNPKDTCVSYYHFLKKLPGYKIESFDDFFEAFLNGCLAYGDFMEHVLGWFEAKHLPNVLFITYEALAENRKEIVKEIATFLQLGELSDSEIESVIKYSSFEYMKSLAEKDVFMQQYLEKSTHLEDNLNNEEKPTMMRKGVVGDWKSIFSPEQSQQMDISFRKKYSGADLWSLWEKSITFDEKN